ncbi:uncharacterized protein [Primulina eburnea]|uniref:uncharacterized protein n=1 Tax=Primulina eburnea TaxID=1245227 RepID=UPI003C6BD9D2
MAADTKSSNLVKVKPGIGDGPSPSSVKSKIIESKKKVSEISIKQSAHAKYRSTNNASKVISKTSRQSKTVTKTVTKTRVKKVYSLPGQKFDVPEEREPLRIFYESLSKQIPSSEMAEFWMMEHGLLSPERAKKAFEKKQRKQKQLRTGNPIKSPLPSRISSKPESSKKPQQVPKSGEVKQKKRVNESDDEDDDFVLSHKRRKG